MGNIRGKLGAGESTIAGTVLALSPGKSIVDAMRVAAARLAPPR